MLVDLRFMDGGGEVGQCNAGCVPAEGSTVDLEGVLIGGRVTYTVARVQHSYAGKGMRTASGMRQGPVYVHLTRVPAAPARQGRPPFNPTRLPHS